MSVNNFKPHILVLPEDDANRQIANGFLLEPGLKSRNIQILPPAGGWLAVIEKFNNSHQVNMSKYPKRIIVFLIDSDGKPERVEDVKKKIDDSLRERVFVLGVFSEPEELKKKLGSFETIGKALGKDCAENTTTAWDHALLKHNSDELARLMPIIKPILF